MLVGDPESLDRHLDRSHGIRCLDYTELIRPVAPCPGDKPLRAMRRLRAHGGADTRAGHCERKLQTKAGKVRLKVPKLRVQTVRDADHQNHRRREDWVEGGADRVLQFFISAAVCEQSLSDLLAKRLSTGRRSATPASFSHLRRRQRELLQSKPCWPHRSHGSQIFGGDSARRSYRSKACSCFILAPERAKSFPALAAWQSKTVLRSHGFVGAMPKESFVRRRAANHSTGRAVCRT